MKAMLMELQIENIAIIDRLTLRLDEGFNVLTGETGAGKSILIDSINALLGSRVSRELIRSGAEKAMVQGLFSDCGNLGPFLEELGVEAQEDGSLLLTRTFTESGKNVCRVNGGLVTVGTLKEIGQRLVDVHGQHDNQSLLHPEIHITLLDQFAGEALLKEKALYHTQLEEYNRMSGQLKKLKSEERERERLLDTLRFQIEEIEQASLKTGEEEELELTSRRLSHSEDILSSFAGAYEAVKGGDDSEDAGAADRLQMALDLIRRVEDIDPAYAEIGTALEDMSEKIADIARDIRRVRDETEYDPRLHKLTEERISLIQGLKRKYGDSIPSVLEYLDKIKSRREELEGSEALIGELEQRLVKVHQSLEKCCGAMSGLRQKAAVYLEEQITRVLGDLEMSRTRFSTGLTTVEEFGPDGRDRVEFLFSSNTGEPMKPLSKIASGGEMSRVMLAVKSILAGTDGIPTLIFDEIDTGISGKATNKVGEKLSALSRERQVLCITHHAQIASLANRHYLISKSETEGRTVTQVKNLEGKEREAEITRLLSGEHHSDAARSLAREMLERNKEKK